MSSNLPPLLPQTGEARLRELATEAALKRHNHAMAYADIKDARGHELGMGDFFGFGVCPHPDCVLVHSAGSAQAPETPPKVRVGDEDIDALTFASRCMNDVAATLDRLVDSNNQGGSWESAGHLRNRVNGSLRSLARGLSTNAERIALAASSSDEQAEGR